MAFQQPSTQNLVLACKGLFTYPNNLSAVPVGALVDADNIYIDRNDVAQPRRGFKVFTASPLSSLCNSLHNYQNHLISHNSTILQYETDPVSQPGVFTKYEESVDGTLVQASVLSPDQAAGLKIKSAEANRNFYFTSSHGIMKIDNVANSIVRSGVPQALDFDLALVDSDGFFTQNSTVAYRVVWGYKDANNNLLLGAPSQRQTIYYYALPQFITDINALLEEISDQSAVLTETYPSPLNSTDTIEDCYTAMKEIVLGLNQETNLTWKEYEAGGTLEISSITTRPFTAITANSYFIFSDNYARFVVWMDLNGTGTQPNPSLQSDLRLTDTFIPVNTATGSVQATLTNQGVTYTAVNYGTGGNAITVTITNPGTPTQPLVIGVSGNAITVSLATNGGSTVTTTATLLVAALNANSSVAALLVASGSGGSALTGLSLTHLAGGTGLDPTNASNIATLVVSAIQGSAAKVNLSTTDNQITLSTLFDADIENTVDGVDPTGFTIANVQEGSTLSGTQITIDALQAAFDTIVIDLNANGGMVTPNFVEARTSKEVSLYIDIPAYIINLMKSGTNFFYQVYRTAIFPLSDAVLVTPDENFQQVFEGVPTSGEITAGFVGPFTDITSNTFQSNGAALYTNPSQEGILQSNYQPPLAKDIALYKNQLFFANTKNDYSLNLSLLTGSESSMGNPGFVVSTYAVLVNQGITYTAVLPGTSSNSVTIHLINPGTPSHALTISVTGSAISVTLATNGGSAITTTATLLVAALAANTAASALVTATGSGASALSALGITNLATGTDGTLLTFTSGSNHFNLRWIPDTGTDNYALGVIALIDPTQGTGDPSDDLSPGQILELMAQKIVKATNRQASNSFMDAYYSSGFNDVPGQILFQSRYLENPIFTITSNETVSDQAFSPELGTSNAVATNDVAINKVFYSKYQQPESCPIVNYFPVGAADKAIIRILASRDSLFVFKEDGVFTISGQEGSLFQLNALDNTCIIKGPESAVIGNNQIFLFTSEGITQVTEGGARVISEQIGDKVLALPNTALYTDLDATTFGVFYNTEKKYYLWLPTLPTDTVATQCFVWNTATQTWTRLPIEKTCGIVNLRDNKLYLGAGDIFQIEEERKHFDIFDYADREFDNQIISFNYDTYTEQLTLAVQSVTNLSVGDAIEQTEYMRPYYFNKILQMLDVNPRTEHDYDTLTVATKGEILAALNNLADKLDADPGVTDTNYRANIDAITGTTPPIVLEKFNLLVTQMNADTGIEESDFPTVDQTPTFYTHVLSISGLTVVVQDDLDFEVGAITTYQAINTLVTWVPNSAGNPANWKHFRESNLMFEDTIARIIDIGFASDVSRNFEYTTKNDDSLAGWGIINWGDEPWGSDPEPRVYRTYIPRVKQRSRYLNAQFKHGQAFQNYLLNGLSISYDMLTERVTR